MGDEKLQTLKKLNIGGRKSQLAVAQSEIVKTYIEARFPEIECSILALSTFGDQVQSKPLYSFGGKALWTTELEQLLLGPGDGHPQLDMIVHSLKDVPTNLPDDFVLGCILDREDPRDAMIAKKGSNYKTLADLPEGSIVGTSSVRRSSQLLKNYPKLRFESVRGNIHTRLRKLDDPESPFECLILAAAGLDRVGLGHRITKRLTGPEMYHAVGQGALGVEIRKNDKELLNILSQIEEASTAYCCIAERSLMRHLEGGCSVPLGVESSYDEKSNVLSLLAIIVSPDGTQSVQDTIEQTVRNKNDAAAVGIRLGDALVNKGGKQILELINYDRVHEIHKKPAFADASS